MPGYFRGGGYDVLCWAKNEVKGCMIKPATHATFDPVVFASRVCTALRIRSCARVCYIFFISSEDLLGQ